MSLRRSWKVLVVIALGAAVWITASYPPTPLPQREGGTATAPHPQPLSAGGEGGTETARATAGERQARVDDPNGDDAQEAFDAAHGIRPIVVQAPRVAPVSIASWQVSGAGTSSVNGAQARQERTLNGQATYTNGKTWLWYAPRGDWVFSVVLGAPAEEWLYLSDRGPTGTWMPINGANPVPTLVAHTSLPSTGSSGRKRSP